MRCDAAAAAAASAQYVGRRKVRTDCWTLWRSLWGLRAGGGSYFGRTGDHIEIPSPSPMIRDSSHPTRLFPTSRLVIQTDSDDLQTPRCNGIWLGACRLLSEAAMI